MTSRYTGAFGSPSASTTNRKECVRLSVTTARLFAALAVLLGLTKRLRPPGCAAMHQAASTFEQSPPSWEPYVNTVAAAAARLAIPAPAADANAPESGFALKGVLSAASANQMAELNAYAAGRSEVVLDMAKVLRVDYGYTATFFDVVKAIQLAGKRVILNNLNELNAALLEALGVNRYAILVRRKSN